MVVVGRGVFGGMVVVVGRGVFGGMVVVVGRGVFGGMVVVVGRGVFGGMVVVVGRGVFGSMVVVVGRGVFCGHGGGCWSWSVLWTWWWLLVVGCFVGMLMVECKIKATRLFQWKSVCFLQHKKYISI